MLCFQSYSKNVQVYGPTDIGTSKVDYIKQLYTVNLNTFNLFLCMCMQIHLLSVYSTSKLKNTILTLKMFNQVSFIRVI